MLRDATNFCTDSKARCAGQHGRQAMIKVLLIDDSATSRAVLRVYLTGRGYELIEVESAETGLQRAAEQVVDVVLVDLKLPGMDGLSFCRSIRLLDAHRTTPVILISGTKGSNLLAESARAGARYFLSKPIDPPTLISMIARCLHERGLQ